MIIGNPGAPPDTEWLNTKKAAERLGITPRTLYRLVDEGEVVAYQIGRLIKFRPADIDAAIQRFRIQPGDLRHLYQEGLEERHQD